MPTPPAEVEDDKILVFSNEVATPVAVRYGAKAGIGKEQLDINLINREKLPASLFTVFTKP